MEHFDVLIIGGGAAGMAAAVSAVRSGKSVLLVDRNEKLGGVLLQCTHKGFGLGWFEEDLTGMEYASRFEQILFQEGNAEIALNTTVTEIRKNKTAVLYGEKNGEVSFDRLVLAAGCREKSLYSLPYSGSRPTGIMTAGMAQKLMNVDELDIGDRIVILGTGDIGQIVARDLIQKGKQIVAMIEKESQPGGLKRNQENCIKAFHIPVKTFCELIGIKGTKRLEGVEIYHKDTSTTEYIPCDVLLTAIGLIPNTSLLQENFGETIPDWVIKTGNCDYVHDIVDTVTAEAMKLFL